MNRGSIRRTATAVAAAVVAVLVAACGAEGPAGSSRPPAGVPAAATDVTVRLAGAEVRAEVTEAGCPAIAFGSAAPAPAATPCTAVVAGRRDLVFEVGFPQSGTEGGAVVYGAASADVADLRFDLPDGADAPAVGAPDGARRRAWAVAVPPGEGDGRVDAVDAGGRRLATVAWTSAADGPRFVTNRPDHNLFCGLLANVGPLAGALGDLPAAERVDLLVSLAGPAPESLADPLVERALAPDAGPLDDPDGVLAAVDRHEATACH